MRRLGRALRVVSISNLFFSLVRVAFAHLQASADSCRWIPNNYNIGGEHHIGKATSRTNCIELVRSRCPWANIANFQRGVNPGACWCQLGSDKRVDESARWESCFLDAGSSTPNPEYGGDKIAREQREEEGLAVAHIDRGQIDWDEAAAPDSANDCGGGRPDRGQTWKARSEVPVAGTSGATRVRVGTVQSVRSESTGSGGKSTTPDLRTWQKPPNRVVSGGNFWPLTVCVLVLTTSVLVIARAFFQRRALGASTATTDGDAPASKPREGAPVMATDEQQKSANKRKKKRKCAAASPEGPRDPPLQLEMGSLAGRGMEHGNQDSRHVAGVADVSSPRSRAMGAAAIFDGHGAVTNIEELAQMSAAVTPAARSEGTTEEEESVGGSVEGDTVESEDKKARARRGRRRPPRWRKQLVLAAAEREGGSAATRATEAGKAEGVPVTEEERRMDCTLQAGRGQEEEAEVGGSVCESEAEAEDGVRGEEARAEDGAAVHPLRPRFVGFEGRSAARKAAARRLHGEVAAFLEEVEPDERSLRVQELIVFWVEAAAAACWAGARVEVYGSCATGLHLPHSDVDLVVQGAGPGRGQSALQQLAGRLRSLRWTREVQAIETASVPVIKLQAVVARLEEGAGAGDGREVAVDITLCEDRGALQRLGVSYSPVACREFVTEELAAIPVMRGLVLVLKQLLFHHGLNDSYSGGLASHSLLLLVIFFFRLVRSVAEVPPRCPRGEALMAALDGDIPPDCRYGEWLLRLLQWLSEFPFDSVGLAVGRDAPGIAFLARTEEGTAMLTNQLPVEAIPLAARRPSHILHLEDPFTQDVNVAKASFRWWQVWAVLNQSWQSLCAHHEPAASHAAAAPSPLDTLFSLHRPPAHGPPAPAAARGLSPRRGSSKEECGGEQRQPGRQSRKLPLPWHSAVGAEAGR